MKYTFFLFYLIAALIIAVPVFAGMKGVALTTVYNSILNAPAYISGGTKFTTTGCSISATSGGATAGTFTLGANTCSAIITMGGLSAITSTTGWTCTAHDRTAVTVLIGGENASNTTTATIPIPAGAGATDVISFSCIGY